MEGERLSLSRFDFQKRHAWSVLDANASRSSAVVSQRSKTCRGGEKAVKDGGGKISQFPGTGNVAPGSVNPVRRRRETVCRDRKVKQERRFIGGGRGVTKACNQSTNQPISQSTNWSINQSLDQSISRSVNQSISQSIDQSWCFKQIRQQKFFFFNLSQHFVAVMFSTAAGQNQNQGYSVVEVLCIESVSTEMQSTHILFIHLQMSLVLCGKLPWKLS